MFTWEGIQVFWDVTMYHMKRHFGGMCDLHLKGSQSWRRLPDS